MSLEEFAEQLRCPETRQRLSVATPAQMERVRDEQAAGRLFYRSGKFVTEPLQTMLIREDGRVLYPVHHGIPVLVAGEAILMGM